MSTEQDLGDIGTYYLTRSFLDVLDSVSKIVAKVGGLGEKERNEAIIGCSVPYLQYHSEDHKATRPIEYLSKYLAGTEEDEVVDLFILLAEDKGVRNSIFRQIT